MIGKLPILYKFHSYNSHLFELLCRNEFYLATHSELNDPFDCKFKITRSFIIELFKERNDSSFNASSVFKLFAEEHDVEQLDQYIERIILFEDKFIQSLLKKLGRRVVSFTEQNYKGQNILMWANYANNFSGVRLKFDFNDSTAISLTENLKSILYEKDLITLNSINQLDEAFYRKAKVWRKEREWRMIEWDFPHFKFPVTSLKQIIFGLNMTYQQQHSIINLTDALGYKCKYYKSVYNNNGLKLESVSRKKKAAFSIIRRLT